MATNNSTNKYILNTHTHLTEDEKRCINDKGLELIKELKDSGLSANEITKLVGSMITHKKKEHEQEVEKKLDEEIKNGNFQEESYYNGRVYVYQKYVEVDTDKKVVEQKIFKSKESYKMWLKLSEKKKKEKKY